MNHIKVKQESAKKNLFGDREWFYNFRVLSKVCSEKEFKKWWQNKYQIIKTQTKVWSDSKQSEWIIRNIMSAKMIMSATLHVNSLEHAKKTNLKVVESYLEYYSTLQAMRALILNIPSQDWKDATLLNQNHIAVINTVCNTIAELNSEEGIRLKSTITRLKANRELISYRAPSSGLRWQEPNVDITYICTLICEIAQAFSELLEHALKGKSNENYKLELEEFSVLYNPKIDGYIFPDLEDLYRTDYLLRKNPNPTNIMHIITEGHVEEFFEAWNAEEENEMNFNPDINWRIIFDLP